MPQGHAIAAVPREQRESVTPESTGPCPAPTFRTCPDLPDIDSPAARSPQAATRTTRGTITPGTDLHAPAQRVLLPRR